MAAEAAESLLKRCKTIIDKYQAKSKYFKVFKTVTNTHYILYVIVDLQSWEKKIAEEKELEYDNEEEVEVEEKINVSYSSTTDYLC